MTRKKQTTYPRMKRTKKNEKNCNSHGNWPVLQVARIALFLVLNRQPHAFSTVYQNKSLSFKVIIWSRRNVGHPEPEPPNVTACTKSRSSQKLSHPEPEPYKNKGTWSQTRQKPGAGAT